MRHAAHPYTNSLCVERCVTRAQDPPEAVSGHGATPRRAREPTASERPGRAIIRLVRYSLVVARRARSANWCSRCSSSVRLGRVVSLGSRPSSDAVSSGIIVSMAACTATPCSVMFSSIAAPVSVLAVQSSLASSVHARSSSGRLVGSGFVCACAERTSACAATASSRRHLRVHVR